MALSQPVPATEYWTDGSILEGMFSRALRPEGDFARALRQAGYDRHGVRARYPSSVWRATLEVARAHVHPELTEREAYRRLGGLLADGWLATFTGRLVAVGLPVLGPARALERFPDYFMRARPGVRVTSTREAERAFVLAFEDPWSIPDFTAGFIAGCGVHTGVRAEVDVTLRAPGGFSLRVYW